ncbi:uncharacterized protein METZ01_LOCUS321753 [marine metagenome]|uniref:Uncharacterized protein n=1 Tax=marine metagenome TaxID=408172 RepID=A0A382P660_9ZZZZ
MTKGKPAKRAFPRKNLATSWVMFQSETEEESVMEGFLSGIDCMKTPEALQSLRGLLLCKNLRKAARRENLWSSQCPSEHYEKKRAKTNRTPSITKARNNSTLHWKN